MTTYAIKYLTALLRWGLQETSNLVFSSPLLSFQRPAYTWTLSRCFRAQLNDYLLWEAVSPVPVYLSSETLQHLMSPPLVAHREVTITDGTRTQASPLVHYRVTRVTLHPSDPVLSTDLWMYYSWVDTSVLVWSRVLRAADTDLGKILGLLPMHDELFSKRTCPRKEDSAQGTNCISHVKGVPASLSPTSASGQRNSSHYKETLHQNGAACIRVQVNSEAINWW